MSSHHCHLPLAPIGQTLLSMPLRYRFSFYQCYRFSFFFLTIIPLFLFFRVYTAFDGVYRLI
jgi:hypothetical protein